MDQQNNTTNNLNKQTEEKKGTSPHPTEPLFRTMHPSLLLPQQQRTSDSITPAPIYRGVSDIANATAFRSSLGDTTLAGFDMSRPVMGARSAKSESQLYSSGFDAFGLSSNTNLKQSLQPMKPSQFFDEPVIVDASVSDDTELSNNTHPVPDVPSYVEKYTSFTSNSFPNDILKKMLEIFKEYSTVDFELHASQYSITGTTYRDHASCNFRVNVFRSNQGYIVEFQRRSGDPMVFNAFFRHVKSKSADLLEDPNLAVTASDNANKFVPPSYDIMLDAESLTPLKNMAESPFVDVAREGMKMLAKCSTASDNHASLATLLPLFSKFLSSQVKDEELARYTAFTLANISKNDAVSKDLSSRQWLEVIVNELRVTENRETCRQLAQVVNNICQSYPEELKSFVPALKTVAGSATDVKLKSVVQSTLGRIEL